MGFDEGESLALKEWTGGDAGVDEKSATLKSAGLDGERVQQNPADADPLVVGRDEKPVDVRIRLKLGESGDLSFGFGHNNEAAKKPVAPKVDIEVVRSPRRDLFRRIVAGVDSTNRVAEQGEKRGGVVGLEWPGRYAGHRRKSGAVAVWPEGGGTLATIPGKR